MKVATNIIKIINKESNYCLRNKSADMNSRNKYKSRKIFRKQF